MYLIHILMAEFKSVAVIKAFECKDELLLYSKANYKVLHRMVSFGCQNARLGSRRASNSF